jgi:GYF domain 2
MTDRSWFFAAEGKQQGPYPEPQFRDLLARGIVRADTLVWSEGMAGWQRAGEVPGLMSGTSARPVIPMSGGAVMGAGHGGGALSLEVGIWSLLGRSLLFVIGLLLIIPAPWTATSFYRWIVSRLDVPGRPNLAFNGQVGDLWYVFVLIGLLSYSGVSDYAIVKIAAFIIQAFLSWMVVRWIVASLSSNGQPLPIEFKGSVWGYVGWYLLLYISFITIIGWAWVQTAWMRWICGNISGTRREIVFNASGLDVLWRTFVLVIACVFLIPIPWMLRWYTRWYVSQFDLVQPGAATSA